MNVYQWMWMEMYTLREIYRKIHTCDIHFESILMPHRGMDSPFARACFKAAADAKLS